VPVPIDWSALAPPFGPKPAAKASPVALDRTSDWQHRFVNHLGAGVEKVDPHLRMRVHLPAANRVATL
jgi:hypothetical protein